MANDFLTAYLLKKYRGADPAAGAFDVDVANSTATAPGLPPPPAAPAYTPPTLTVDDLDRSSMPPGLEPVATTPEMFEGDPFTRNLTPNAKSASLPPVAPAIAEPPAAPKMPPLPPGAAPMPSAPPIAPPGPSAAPSAPLPAPMAPAMPDPLAGFGPADREKVVGEQGTSGRELLGQSLAGIGDAVSKAAGGSGGHLRGALDASAASRTAAVENFDKGRAQAMQNYDVARKVIENNRGDAAGADMQNPGSPISRAQQALLDRLEPGKDHSKISALQAEVLVKPLLEKYKIEETTGARKDAASDRLALIEANRDQRVSKQNEDRIQDIRKEITGSKAYQNWLEIKNANDNLQNAAANPGAKRSLGAVYSWVKALDPGSVVREGEIKLAGEARSVGQKLEGYFRRMATGAVLLPEEIRELAEWAKEKEGLARQTAVASNDPAIQQAKRNQFDLAEINKDLFGGPAAAPSGGSNEVRRKTADGRIIVYDAVTKKPLREETVQ